MIDFTRKKEIENERGIGRKKHFFFSFKIFNCLEEIIAQKKKKKPSWWALQHLKSKKPKHNYYL